MKKKIAALLTAAFVMTMSAATVFAAGSPEASTTVGTKVEASAKDADGNTVEVTSTTLDTSDAEVANAVKSADSVLVNIQKSDSDAKIALLTEISADGFDFSKSSLTVVLNVPGAVKGNEVRVYNYRDGAWVEMNARVVADGQVKVIFDHLSPVLVITQSVAVDNGNTTTGSETTSATGTSPKTGVIPFAAMTAGICLAGAAVCGKKVKFN